MFQLSRSLPIRNLAGSTSITNPTTRLKLIFFCFGTAQERLLMFLFRCRSSNQPSHGLGKVGKRSRYNSSIRRFGEVARHNVGLHLPWIQPFPAEIVVHYYYRWSARVQSSGLRRIPTGMYYMVDVNLRPATNRCQAMRAAGLPAIFVRPFAPPKCRTPTIPHVIS
ncbi:hypothetical protein OG21DRAFT_1054473 [Imleria badia]|nr:hypothetical protein OG21DRAFT_1054473 [Imleria badia]